MKRGEVDIEDSINHPGERVVKLWPKYDDSDHVELSPSVVGVLFAIIDNEDPESNSAVFLTIPEMEKLLEEARLVQASRTVKSTVRQATEHK